MECMHAWEYIELAPENAGLAEVTLLLGVDGNVLVPLLPLLLSELLSALAVIT